MTTTGMTELETSLASLTERFDRAVSEAVDERALDDVRVAFLGRSGEVTNVRRGIGALPAAERPSAGKVINAAVESMEARLASAFARIERDALSVH
jgi:phenylalanyl-tRNA synthetase alpha chain